MAGHFGVSADGPAIAAYGGTSPRPCTDVELTAEAYQAYNMNAFL